MASKSLLVGYYCANMTRPGMELDHGQCDNLECAHYDTAKDPTYLPIASHKSKECNCDLLRVDGNELYDALRKGLVPLIEVKLGKRGIKDSSARMVYRPNPVKYVALSHVWSDALGDTTKNALPLCRLIKVQQCVARISAQFENGTVSYMTVSDQKVLPPPRCSISYF
jgi:hypothetical protein